MGATLESTAKNLPEETLRAWVFLLGNSNFLARWTRRYPDQVQSLLQQDFSKVWSEGSFKEELDRKLPPGEEISDTTLSEALLDFKYRHFYRITLRDMGLQKPLVEIAQELSSLAKVILEKSLQWQKNSLQKKWGVPGPDSINQSEIPFTVLALGKLGGNELNFSSDVDLIYCHGSDQGGVFKDNFKTEFTPHQFFSKLGENLGRFLSQKTAEGFLYRVDLDLRPEGKAGTITNSLEAMEAYYETFGAYWEKQAMIKVAWAGGSHELFGNFAKMIRPFVYPKTHDFNLIAKVHEMKKKVQESVQSSSEAGYHVKLGSGGIREIEFFVQTFQILYGGSHASLQSPNTLNGLSAIADLKLIEREDAETLKQAYLFLRTLENRLQQVEEQQKHRLPESTEELIQLSRRMGYLQDSEEKALELFSQDLDRHRRYVKQRFEALLDSNMPK
ncbi:MAG: hypothetical protein R3257_07670 [bacterium]|nr:hypothetical protein [bacterium]